MTGRAVGRSMLHHQNGLRYIGQKHKLSPSCASCSCVSHKGRAEEQCSWWLHHVSSLPEWGNRRWHLADSLTLADLLGLGWLLWFWNYTLDELEHFTKKKKKKEKDAEMGQAESTLRETGNRKRRRRLFMIKCIKLATGRAIINVWSD